jgi:hypothetical protein
MTNQNRGDLLAPDRTHQPSVRRACGARHECFQCREPRQPLSRTQSNTDRKGNQCSSTTRQVYAG